MLLQGWSCDLAKPCGRSRRGAHMPEAVLCSLGPAPALAGRAATHTGYLQPAFDTQHRHTWPLGREIDATLVLVVVYQIETLAFAS